MSWVTLVKFLHCWPSISSSTKWDDPHASHLGLWWGSYEKGRFWDIAGIQWPISVFVSSALPQLSTILGSHPSPWCWDEYTQLMAKIPRGLPSIQFWSPAESNPAHSWPSRLWSRADPSASVVWGILLSLLLGHLCSQSKRPGEMLQRCCLICHHWPQTLLRT